jgi:hypothetical protein
MYKLVLGIILLMISGRELLCLTLNLLNFLNGLVQLTVLEQSIISFGGIKMKNIQKVTQQYRAWSADCMNVQTGWFYTGDKD